MDIKQAYSKLGVSEQATREEIETQYEMWMRKYKAQQRQSTTPQENLDFDTINKAYRFIQTHYLQQEQQQHPTKQMSPLREKADHFIHYYKFHVAAAIAIIIFLSFLVSSVVENRREAAELAKLPPADLEMMVFGVFAMPEDLSQVEQNVLQLFPDWQRVALEFVYSPVELRNEADIAYQQKSVIMLMESHPDLFLLDEANFDRLVSQGLFMPLSSIETDMETKVSKAQLKFGQVKDDPETHLYGIDVTHSPFINRLDIMPEDRKKILAVRTDADHPEQALHYIQEAVEALNQDR